jgi:hypothetical protein
VGVVSVGYLWWIVNLLTTLEKAKRPVENGAAPVPYLPCPTNPGYESQARKGVFIVPRGAQATTRR